MIGAALTGATAVALAAVVPVATAGPAASATPAQLCLPRTSQIYVSDNSAYGNNNGGIMQIDPAWGAFQPQWITYFSVADADKAVATAVELGGQAMSAVEDTPFGRMAALMDPAGAFFKIVEPPAR